MAKQLKITLKKGLCGTMKHHRGNVRALGLRRRHQSVIKEDTPVLRGMIHAVRFMIDVEEVEK